MKKLLALFTLVALVGPRRGPAPKKKKPPQRPIEEELKQKEGVQQAQSDADRIAELMTSPEAASWPHWLSVGLVSAGVAIAVGPELLAYYGLTGAAELTAAEVAALAFDAAQLIYGASQSAQSHVANVSGLLYQLATSPAQASFLRLVQSQLEGMGVSWMVGKAIE